MVARSVPVTAAAVACLVLAAVAGCGLWGNGSGSAGDGRPAPGTRLDFPAGTLGVSAWLPDGQIYVVWSADLNSPPEIWQAAPGRPAARVDLPAQDGCRRTDYLLPHRLPDGRLGLSRWCLTDNPEQDRIDLVAYDPGARRVELLAPLGAHNDPGAVSWRRDLQSGYISHGSGICDGFAALSRQGVRRLPGEPVTLDGRTWRLDQQLFQTGEVSCRDQGRAAAALLTPDERRLVFLASPGSQGASGQARLDHPWHVYLMDLPDGQPRRLAGDFADVRGTAVAPDGRHLAVAGRRGNEQGLWLVDLESGAMRTLAGGRFAYPSFSPDGRQVATALRLDDDRAELRVIDLAG